MFFLAHYELRNRKMKKIIEKQGIVTAGNPVDAIRKVTELVGINSPHSIKEITVLEHESLYCQETEKGLHKIQVCYVDRLMTLKDKGGCHD